MIYHTHLIESFSNVNALYEGHYQVLKGCLHLSELAKNWETSLLNDNHHVMHQHIKTLVSPLYATIEVSKGFFNSYKITLNHYNYEYGCLNYLGSYYITYKVSQLS